MTATLCPSCQVRLQVPEQKLHSRIRCPKCGARFVAQAAAAPPAQVRMPMDRQRARPARRLSARPFVILLIAAVLSLVAWWWITEEHGAAGPAAATAPAVAPGPARPAATSAANAEDPLAHPAAKAVRNVQVALASFNPDQLLQLLDLPSWYAREDQGGRPWTSLTADEQRAWGRQLAERLLEDPQLRSYASLQPAEGSFAAPPDREAVLFVRVAAQPGRRWRFELAESDGAWRLRGFGEEEDLVAAAATEGDGGAAAAAAGIYTETEGGGRILRGTVAKVDLVPGTTPAEEKEILAKLDLALAESGLESRLAKRELVALGHHAVPVLLNRLADLPLDGSHERTALIAALHGMLQDLTWRRATFPLRDIDAGTAEDLRARQQEAIEAWYGWWKAWGKRWDAWVEQSGMPQPEPLKEGRTRR